MRAAEFVYQLAPKIGVDQAEVEAADRHLANAGLRAKSVGRDYPDLTTKEALRLPLALMCARAPSRAAADVADVEAFRLWPHGVEKKSGDPACLKRLIGLSIEEIAGMDLIDVLVAMARHLAAPWGSKPNVLAWVEAHHGGPVMVQIDGDGFKGELMFAGVMDHVARADMTRTATLGIRTIAWIGAISREASEA